MNLMGEAEGRQQLPTAFTQGILHKRVAFITAGKLFPFIVGGIWEECRSHRTGLFKIILMEAALPVQGRRSKWELVTNLHCSTC